MANERFGLIHRNRVRACVIAVAVAGGVALAVPASAPAVVTCGFAGSTVTVTLTEANDNTRIIRDGAAPPNIMASNGAVDCGTATLFNTDTIVVNDTSPGNTEVFIDQANGGFGPGLTQPEPTGTSEIEFRVDLGVGTSDLLGALSPTPNAGNIRSGTLGVNLNNAESPGDADVTNPAGDAAPAGVERIQIGGSGLADVLGANGGAGTGTGAPDNLLHVYFAGAGPDQLFGGNGPEEFFAEAGSDSIFARDGVSDTVHCGADADTVETDAPGVDILNDCETTLFPAAVIPVPVIQNPPLTTTPPKKKCKKGFKLKKGKCKRKKKRKR
jgi:hypothetical protein